MELKRKQELIAEDTSLPWLPYEVIFFLERVMKKTWHVFEWGSGCSTFWLNKRVASVTSVETDKRWAGIVGEMLTRKRYPKISLITTTEDLAPSIIEDFVADEFDLVVVDGKNRSLCLRSARAKTKVGGYVLLDNTDREEEEEAAAYFDFDSYGFKRMDFEGYGRSDPRQPARRLSGQKQWKCTIWKREA